MALYSSMVNERCHLILDNIWMVSFHLGSIQVFQNRKIAPHAQECDLPRTTCHNLRQATIDSCSQFLPNASFVLWCLATYSLLLYLPSLTMHYFATSSSRMQQAIFCWTQTCMVYGYIEGFKLARSCKVALTKLRCVDILMEQSPYTFYIKSISVFSVLFPHSQL